MMSLSVGTALEPWEIVSVSAPAMHTLAKLLDDPNPIHLDPAAVQRVGLGDRTINQGPAGLGYIFEMLRRNEIDAVLQEARVRFRSNVFAGDHVIATGTVADVRDEGGKQIVICDVALDIVDGARAIEGTVALLAR